MHAAWTAFATQNDPACEETGDWNRYDAASREVMEFGERVGPLRDPSARTRALWDGVR
jgi:carboxylesterase type B